MKRLLQFVLLCWLTPTAVLAELDRPKSIEETLDWMAEALAEYEGVSNVRVDSEGRFVDVELGPDNELKLFPDNLYLSLTQLDEHDDRQEALDRHIRVSIEAALRDPESHSGADLNRIYPVLRHRSYKENIEVLEPGQKIVAGTILGDSEVLFVYDSEQSVSFVQMQDLEALELNRKSLREHAYGNLRRKYDDLTIDGDGLYYLVLDGFYESSFVTFKPLWRELVPQFQELLMVFPTRDLVVFADGAHHGSEQALREVARDFSSTSAYMISELIYRWEGDGWQPID